MMKTQMKMIHNDKEDDEDDEDEVYLDDEDVGRLDYANQDGERDSKDEYDEDDNDEN